MSNTTSPVGPSCTHRETCRLCDSAEVELVFPMGPTPIADAYVPPDHPEHDVYPLDLYLCRECGHVQLLDVVDPDVLFRDYIYETSISKGLVKHFETYAREIIERTGATAGDLVVDVGSNDGSLLSFFRERGMRVLGVDPASRIAESATMRGIPTLPVFFTPEIARQIAAEHGQASVVTANNVFAHADDLASMADGVRELLAPNGIFVFEVSYLLDILEQSLFDTVYHEHLSYHSVAPLQKFFTRHGLELINIERLTNKGGSIRGTVQRRGGPRKVSASVGELLDLEHARGLSRPEVFRDFAHRVGATKDRLHEILDEITGPGRAVIGFGASATVTTLVYHFDLGERLSHLVDDNLRRHGLSSPGHRLRVHSPHTIYEELPGCVVILAWQYSAAIMRNHAAYQQRGGRFVVPLPEVGVH